MGIRSTLQAVETLSGGQRQCMAVARAAAFAEHVGVQRVCQAVLSLLPLDASVVQPLACIKVCNNPDGYRSTLQREELDGLAARGW